jgi:hypothetical protein
MKKYLVYATGLSVDKQRLNTIIGKINDDNDFSYFRTFMEKFLKDIKSSEKFLEYKKQINNKVDNLGLFNSLFSIYTAGVFPVARKLVDTMLGSYLSKNIKTLQILSPELYNQFINNLSEDVLTYKNIDFFNVFVSNQSDVNPSYVLSNVLIEKKHNFSHTFCDRPYYENKYVDHVELLINKNVFEKYRVNKESDIKNLFESVFSMHAIEIFLSKLLATHTLDKKEDIESFYDLGEISNNKTMKDLKNSLKDRQFFGITLLSYFFSSMIAIKPKLNIKCILNENYEKEYIKELLTMASEPNMFNFNSQEKEDISVKISFSDGISSRKNTTLPNDKDFSHYYDVDGYKTEVKIIIPIKMFLSLPLNNDNNPQFDIAIPNNVNIKSMKDIDVLTVGGAEHNRALAHLINLYRLENEEKRIYGFMDNYFDFKLKVSREQHEHDFLMGINQPVAGFNAILAQREINDNGESKNPKGKILSFKLTNNCQKFHIVTLYGFSAIASGYLALTTIADIKKRLNEESNLFYKGLSLQHMNLNPDSEMGHSTLITYLNKNQIDEIFKEQLNSYNPFFSFQHINDTKLYTLFTKLERDGGIIEKSSEGYQA